MTITDGDLVERACVRYFEVLLLSPGLLSSTCPGCSSSRGLHSCKATKRPASGGSVDHHNIYIWRVRSKGTKLTILPRRSCRRGSASGAPPPEVAEGSSCHRCSCQGTPAAAPAARSSPASAAAARTAAPPAGTLLGRATETRKHPVSSALEL